MNNFDYKNMTPFKWFVLENFPFIENNFEAIDNYRLFSKVVEYLNKTIDNMNLTGEQMENVTNAMTELQNYVNNYFENLDVQEEINNKLNEMVEDGTLQELIAPYLQIFQNLLNQEINTRQSADNSLQNQINVEKARIDNITTLPEGSTSGDAELEDIRIAYNGITYSSAGDSVRAQAGDNNGKIIGTYKENLFPESQWVSTSKSDNGIWLTNRLYKSGFIKNINMSIDSENDETGFITFYTDNGDGTARKFYTKNFTGHGDLTITMNIYIPKDFYVAIRCPNLKYKSFNNGWYTKAITNYDGNENESLPNANSNSGHLYHCYNLNMIGYSYLINDVNYLKIPPISLLKASDPYIYNIIYDFTTKKINLRKSFVEYLKEQYKAISLDNTEINFTEENEGYYAVVLNTVTHSIQYLYFANNSKTFQNFKNYLFISCVYYLPNNNQKCFIMNINPQYILCKYPTTNVTNTSDDTIYNNTVPYYAPTKEYSLEISKNQWYNRQISFLGDSICKGEDPNNGYKRMTNDNIASICSKQYGLLVAENLGIGGCSVAVRSNRSDSLIERYNQVSAQADLIVIFAGTNDYNANVELGSYSVLNNNEQFISAYYNLIYNLQNAHPNAKILCLTPLKRENGNVPNNLNYTLNDYCNAIIEICQKRGVQYLDMRTALNGNPDITAWKNLYMPDGLHPSINGMKKFVGTALISKINNIYPTNYFEYK